MRRAAIALLGIVVLLVVSLAVPVPGWRRGEPAPLPFPLAPAPPLGEFPLRVWLDTDAACGQSGRTDPDDCFAMLLLARAPRVRLAGISTVGGNAPLDVADSTARALATVLERDGVGMPPVHRGAAGLAAALAEGPLVIVALGPLTNVAEVLGARPGLRANVTAVVAVMGRRRGHLFHPVEGGSAGSFLGHGPVFTDFNFRKDPDAAAAVLASGVPLRLVPYEAAREVAIGAAVLDSMARRGGADRWVAERARGWLGYWKDDIGRDGFYPFDLVAARSVVEPGLLACVEVSAWVGRDAGIPGWLGRRGLFADEATEAAAAAARGRALYCPEVRGPPSSAAASASRSVRSSRSGVMET
jgi:inosine-uridine nucleoside N-ribohydrolase